MELQIVAIHFFADEVLKANHFHDDPQAHMSTAEVMTVAITAARFFYGNQRRSAEFLREHRYISHFLSESHFNRRLHRIPKESWQQLFSTLSEYFKKNHPSNDYVVDSFPIPVCDNIRIFRSKIFSDEQYRGYIANKKRFFYGIRAHVVATTNQEPIEVVFAPGCENDGWVFKRFDLDLPKESTIYADKAYNSYFDEDFLKENGINFVAARKENAKRKLSGCLHYLQNYWRKRIETTFSRITAFFPKKIHAVTSRGFELKAFLFILAYSLSLVIH